MASGIYLILDKYALEGGVKNTRTILAFSPLFGYFRAAHTQRGLGHNYPSVPLRVLCFVYVLGLRWIATLQFYIR